MGKFARKLGYILAIGSTLALFSYGFYILVPKITPYLTRPVSLILMIGLGGILLIILGLIIERINEDR
ncbi:hypothetical protein KGY58_04670 [Candidatus Bipolaricaulota bacterium]|nr:hypothetical protein [Candidatus Bipolaricaulota bacterium]